MKNLTFILIIFLTSYLVAQELPQPSPKAIVEQRVGLTDITITYSRPGVKGRIIWGDLVPYDKIWRTGANKAVEFKVSDAIEVNGIKLDSGAYSLFTIPSKEEWTVIINKNTELWGADDYKDSEDMLRFKVKPQPVPPVERMLFTIDNVTDEGTADISLSWEKLKISFPVQADANAKAMKNIEKAIAEAKEGEWRVYTKAADYCASTGKNIDRGLEWVNKALEIEDYWWSRWVKAELLAAKKDYKAAITNAQKAIELGDAKYKAEQKEFTYKGELEKEIIKW